MQEISKIKGDRAAANSIAMTDKAPHLDQASKEILANKVFLAIILKHTAKEYSDMEVDEIARCIEADSISRTEEVTPGRTNQDRIDAVGSEFGALNEHLSQFDICFKAINPKMSNEEVTCYLHFDVEAQNDYQPGYLLEKRGIYYMSRMISSQIAAPDASNIYATLEKVYSIWICRENIPKNLQNSISKYELINTWNSRDVVLNQDAHDLMTMVIIRLGDLEEENQEEIIELFNALFNLRSKKSYEILKKHIDFDDALNEEVKKMSGLGESIFIEGVEKGVVKAAFLMYKKGYPINEIAETLELSVEKIEEIVREQEVLV